eukprot:TRINITY_DN58005_c0_g1_i1.p1 TRINITY_DN58005_c0_g1~~TRINITY_DN58005_c0_g1_i1.p1  ORF type:complete len:165 (+),score=33.81 TRINITY_DN58005_c0_g1_i1:82-576(+)
MRSDMLAKRSRTSGEQKAVTRDDVLALSRKAELTDADMLALNQALLDSIGAEDYDLYKILCDVDMSCFEPEAKGHLVTGLDFHKYYFDYFGGLPKGNAPSARTTMAAPFVRWMCDHRAAVVCFKRLVQRGSETVVTEETRVWEFTAVSDHRSWKLVHFHRGSSP